MPVGAMGVISMTVTISMAVTITMAAIITMIEARYPCTPLALLRLQAWLSPTFPIGAYSYSHGLEWAVETGEVCDRASLVDWLSADLQYGSGRNEAIFFSVASRHARAGKHERLLEVAELAAVWRGTAEFALESSQQATACLSTLREVWPDALLDWVAEVLKLHSIQPSVAVVLGAGLARLGVDVALALPAFLQSYTANLANAAVRLIPLGQTDGQRAIAELESTVLSSSDQAVEATLEELGSAAFMVDLASMAHETQYTRLFRS